MNEIVASGAKSLLSILIHLIYRVGTVSSIAFIDQRRRSQSGNDTPQLPANLQTFKEII